jgi:hypothetical protein
MTRYEMIAYALQLTEALFCKLYYVNRFIYEQDFEDLRLLRHSLLNRVFGNYANDLCDLSEAGIEQFIEHVHKEIAVVK